MASKQMSNVRDNARGQPISPRWDISQETAFTETLLGQRFNFLLVFFSLVTGGAINARESPLVQASVLSMGGVICLCLMLAIHRAQQKLDLIIKVILQDPEHPVTVIDGMATGPSRRRLIGYYIPTFCFVSLACWALLEWAMIAAKHGSR
jgi:hypothetical protein